MISLHSPLPRLFFRQGLPLHLIFFVTAKCNLACQHCFYWSRLNRKSSPLTLPQIKKISRSLGRLYWLALTGGEPFLRPDLGEIASTFIRNNRVKHLSIPTNGWLTEHIRAETEKIVSAHPATGFSVTVACDGLEKTHDRLRGKKGSFRKAIATVQRLKQIKAANLGVGIVFTLNQTNQNQAMDTYTYLRDQVKPDDIIINLVRGEPKKASLTKVDLKYYRQLTDQKIADLRSGRLPYYRLGLVGKAAAARDAVMYRRISHLNRPSVPLLPCLAGRLSAVINETGDVFPCELLKQSFGNLHEVNYNFKKLWENSKAKQIRRQIKLSRCRCTHECFLTTNILFSPKTYPQLLWQLLKLNSPLFPTSRRPL